MGLAIRHGPDTTRSEKMKCLFCGYVMSEIDSDDRESLHVCDCGATCVHYGYGCLDFRHEAEDRCSFIQEDFYHSLMGTSVVEIAPLKKALG